MSLNFDPNGWDEPKKQPEESPARNKITRSARRVQARKAHEAAEAERRRQVEEFVEQQHLLTPEERRNAARIHEEFCELKDLAAQFERVPSLDRLTTIALNGGMLVSKTEGDILPEAYTLWLVDKLRWLEKHPEDREREGNEPA